MSYQEAILQIKALLENPSSITISDLEAVINGLSVCDALASEDAVTHLYTKVDNYDFGMRWKCDTICI